MSRLIACLDFYHQELTVSQCVLQIQQFQKGPGVFSQSLKLDDATERLFQEFVVLNFSQLVKTPLSCMVCEARLSRVCSRRSVFCPWCWCKDSIDAVAPPYRGARSHTRVEWRGWRIGEGSTCTADFVHLYKTNRPGR